MTTEEMCREIVNRIGDHLKDPEPESDALLENIPPYLVQQLRHGCWMALKNYDNFKGGE